jgi:cobalt-precorrin-5B (C1)-methyltransferase
MSTKVPPRDRKGLRTGFTTGACAAAAARAATRVLVTDCHLEAIEVTIPRGDQVRFALERCEHEGGRARCSVIKDAGDDPDCTHGAEIVAEVELRAEPGVELRGGVGVATVTKPGLGLVVGGPAINPVPRRNITAMVEAELVDSPWRGACVTISVPDGEERAKQTTNARLGLLGGISILGTTGIVLPYSTAAYKASVVQAIDVARERGLDQIVVTTGGKSETYAMRLLPELPVEAFIQVGDFIGVAVKHAARRAMARVTIVGMMGKLSKMADGRMQTHAAASEVNLDLLADLAAELGAAGDVVARIRAANTARHVLEIATETGIGALPSRVCRGAAEQTARHAGNAVPVHAYLVDFDGTLLGRFPLPHTVDESTV